MSTFPLDGYEFGVCLTHDVDRPFKSLQAPFYALRDRDPGHLASLLPERNPWWQFDRVTEIEEELGVRSAFYFLREPHLFRERSPANWLDPTHLVEHLGRYDPASPPVADVVRELDAGGWEVGVHGSLGTDSNPDRLREEKERLESVVGHELRGGRQHHLRMTVPDTWHHYRDLGLRYDASLGSATRIGFDGRYDVLRPFDDEFVVFPLTVMDKTLFGESETVEAAWCRCERLLDVARERNGVMTVLWHLRNFSELDYPGQARVYRRVVERALEMGAWVGSPGDLLDRVHGLRGVERVARRNGDGEIQH